ncbi:sodium:calcium antiporter [Saccharopolyspora gloriosae]|uniref:sodium:calcium antiporter n=1 Tax=Saccharopolyspora gloriosae TaxID=455344 RepID=UPI001FB6587F|nr:sodium:proton exchanger [Saccharopolyspora gloriosae]
MMAVLEFALGIALLVYSAEKLIGYLVGVSSRWVVSLFLVAVLFTGIEFDDLAYGIVLNVEELQHAALGTVIGTTIAIMGIVLALAALIAPCRVDVPKDYLVLFAAGPLAMLLFATTGGLTQFMGVVLVVLFVAFVGWIGYREYAARRPVFRSAEFYEQVEKAAAVKVATASESGATGEQLSARTPAAGSGTGGGFELPGDLRVDQRFLKARQRPLWGSLLFALLALAGLIGGAALAGQGTEGVLETFDMDGTVFGVTIATLALSLEDIFLTVEPARRGAPEIGVANVIGSVVFSLTGKLGIVLLVGGSITVGENVLSWHLPVLLGMTVLSAIFLATGHLRRWHGAVLLALYAGYFVISLTVFGGVPIDSD